MNDEQGGQIAVYGRQYLGSLDTLADSGGHWHKYRCSYPAGMSRHTVGVDVVGRMNDELEPGYSEFLSGLCRCPCV